MEQAAVPPSPPARTWRHRLRENVLVATVMAALWLVLGWLRSFGVQSVFLAPLNFLTGALSGVDGGSFIGGMMGKALVMMALSSFLRPLLLKKGSIKVRLQAAGRSFGLRLLKKIPGYVQVKAVQTGDAALLSCAALGLSFAFFTYPFLTGNGSFQNSFVCLLLGFSLWKTLLRQKGLVLSVLNHLLGKLGRRVNEKKVLQVIAGGSLGYTVTAALSVFRATGVSFALGGVCLLAGVLGLAVPAVRRRKGAAA